MTKSTYTYRHPTPEELYAVESQARRLRAQTIAETLRKGLTALKGLFARPAVRNLRHSARNVRHA